jgi:hypothetical protein
MHAGDSIRCSQDMQQRATDSSALVSRKSFAGGSVRPIGADSQWPLKRQIAQAEDCSAPFQGSPASQEAGRFQSLNDILRQASERQNVVSCGPGGGLIQVMFEQHRSENSVSDCSKCLLVVASGNN